MPALGVTLWSSRDLAGKNASLLNALLRVPDMNADGSPDLLLLTQEGTEVPYSTRLWEHPAPLTSTAGLAPEWQ